MKKRFARGLLLSMMFILIAMPAMAFADDEEPAPEAGSVVAENTGNVDTGARENKSDEPAVAPEPKTVSPTETPEVVPAEEPKTEDEVLDPEQSAPDETIVPEPETTPAPAAEEPEKVVTIEDEFPGLRARLSKKGYVDLEDLRIPALREGEVAAVAASYGDKFEILSDGVIIAVNYLDEKGNAKAKSKKSGSSNGIVAETTDVIVEEEPAEDTADEPVIEAAESEDIPAPEEESNETPISEFYLTLSIGFIGAAKFLKLLI